MVSVARLRGIDLYEEFREYDHLISTRSARFLGLLLLILANENESWQMTIDRVDLVLSAKNHMYHWPATGAGKYDLVRDESAIYISAL